MQVGVENNQDVKGFSSLDFEFTVVLEALYGNVSISATTDSS